MKSPTPKNLIMQAGHFNVEDVQMPRTDAAPRDRIDFSWPRGALNYDETMIVMEVTRANANLSRPERALLAIEMALKQGLQFDPVERLMCRIFAPCAHACIGLRI